MKNKINIFIILLTSFILWNCATTKEQEIYKPLPVIFSAEGYTCFDAVEPIIDFTISPFIGINIIEGKVIDKSTGSTVARLNFKGRDEVAGIVPPPYGGARGYFGYVDSKLSPGKYDVEITHKIPNKESNSMKKFERNYERTFELINSLLEELSETENNTTELDIDSSSIEIGSSADTTMNLDDKINSDVNYIIINKNQYTPEKIKAELDKQYEEDFKEDFTREEYNEFVKEADEYVKAGKLNYLNLHTVINLNDYLETAYERGVANGKLSILEEFKELLNNIDYDVNIKTIPLEVFKTGLVNEGLLKSQVTFAATYGNYVIVNAEPNSGGKIKPNQFRTYLFTDAGDQKTPVQGYTVQQADAPFCSSNSNNLSLRITWIQPNTGKEIDIFPQDTFPIVQKPPKLNIGDKSVSIAGQERKISVRITRLSAIGTPMGDAPGSTEKADVDVTLGKIDISGIEGFEYVEGSGFVEKGDSGTYSVYFDITGKLPKGQDRIIGTIQVPLSAVAKNTLNGKISKPDRKQISVPVNYEPEPPGRMPGRRPVK